jgi:hypothetical protein
VITVRLSSFPPMILKSWSVLAGGLVYATVRSPVMRPMQASYCRPESRSEDQRAKLRDEILLADDLGDIAKL